MGATKRPKIVTKPECGNCPSLCCRDMVLPIEKPKTREDVEELKWQIQYDTISVFVRSYRWYLLIKGKCMYLSRDNLCKIYERRPDKCRRLSPPDCERYGDFYDVLIKTPEELEDYLGRKLPRSRKSRAGRRL